MPSLIYASSRSIRCNDASRTWINLSHFLLFTIYYRTCCDSLSACRMSTAKTHTYIRIPFNGKQLSAPCAALIFDEIGLNTWRSLVFFNLPLLLLHSLLRCFSSPCAYLHCFRTRKRWREADSEWKRHKHKKTSRVTALFFLSLCFFVVFTIYCYILHVCIVCIYLYTMFTSNHVFCSLLLFYLFFSTGNLSNKNVRWISLSFDAYKRSGNEVHRHHSQLKSGSINVSVLAQITPCSVRYLSINHRNKIAKIKKII